MPSKSSDPRKWLLDIRDNIRLASAFIEGADFDAFRDNQLLFYAVTRALEIISEASRRIPDDMKARHPNIPWVEMAGRATSTGMTTKMYVSSWFGEPYKIGFPPCWRL